MWIIIMDCGHILHFLEGVARLVTFPILAPVLYMKSMTFGIQEASWILNFIDYLYKIME